MTTKDALQKFGFDAAKLIAWGIAFGVAYASITNRLDALERGKADKIVIEMMARDIRIMRIVVCEQFGAADSFCKGD